uniref:Uncharacterized protein n=1 Tax=Arundo donax TaxID=35708 RepID=A0A0A8Y0N1_ARUDO
MALSLSVVPPCHGMSDAYSCDFWLLAGTICTQCPVSDFRENSDPHKCRQDQIISSPKVVYTAL